MVSHQNGNKSESHATRHTLLEKLRQKMGINNRTEAVDDSSENFEPKLIQHLKNNKMAEKTTRKSDIGWFHKGKQVRKRSGGGTRAIDISKNAKKSDILSKAKELFFPRGVSKKGQWENFSHDAFDFQESELEDEITVGELYTVLKMVMLRFYLSTKCIPPDDELNVSDTETQAEMHTPEEQCETPIISVDSTDSLSQSSEVIIGPYAGESMVSQLDDTLLYEPMHLPVTQDSDLAITNFIYPSTSDVVSMIDLSLTEEAFSPVADQVDDAAHAVNSSASEYELLHVTIKLHRITLLDEMTGQFKDPSLITYTLKYSIIDEMGADEDGVSRDVYSGFWSEFLDRAAEGEDMRVPSLSPKWQVEDWKSIGRILAKGYKDQGYFPTRLATAFTVALIFGENSVTDEMMIN